MVPTVVRATKKSYGTKKHKEKNERGRRHQRFFIDDSSDLSEECLGQEEDNGGNLSVLLRGLAEAY
jgi:hypothetical protein